MVLGWIEYTAIALAVALGLVGLWFVVRACRWLVGRARANWPEARAEIAEMFAREERLPPPR